MQITIRRTEKERSRFQANGESGRVFTVIEFEEYREIRSLNGPDQIVPGLRRISLADGSPLEVIDTDTFKIVETDEIIRKVR